MAIWANATPVAVRTAAHANGLPLCRGQVSIRSTAVADRLLFVLSILFRLVVVALLLLAGYSMNIRHRFFDLRLADALIRR